MQDNLVAISSNDFKNVASDTFGQSHYFMIYRMETRVPQNVETRENVLFMRSCDLQGRAEHLHGLLGDVKFFVGTKFNETAREYLKKNSHQLIEVEAGPVAEIIMTLPSVYENEIQDTLAKKE